MKNMLFVLFVLSLAGCRSDKSNKLREEAAQNVLQAQYNLDANAGSSRELTLTVGQKSARKGDQLCVSVTANGFSGLISMQYTIRWDPKVLRFEKVSNYNIPWLSEDNFGMHVTDEGLVTFVWIDNDLRGVDVDNGSEIYQLCFTAIGESGQESEVTLSEDPTPFEVVTAEEKIIPLKPVVGKISIQ